MKYAIFTHVDHIEREGRYYAYAPYVREMNIWLKHVEEVEVVGTRRKGDLGTRRVMVNDIPYTHSKLTFTEVPAFNLLNFLDALKAFVKIPYIFFKMFSAMKRADHLHLRCPGNVGLLACICQIFFLSKPKSAKYAGNWDPKAKQPWTYRLQKWILSNTFLTRNMKVLVYGEWSGQSKNIVPFFTASFSEKEKAEVGEKYFSGGFIFLFVGNFVEGKRPLQAIKLVEELNRGFNKGQNREIKVSMEMYGNGPEREELEAYVKGKQLEKKITFKGNRSLEELKEAYQNAHFVILPSKSEGWPKAIAEGMFFGCIPIATRVSCVPWMLGGGSRGILLTGQAIGQQLIANGSKEWSVVSGQDVLKITQLLADHEEMKRMSEEAKKWSQQYTLEKFEVEIKKVLLHPNEEINVSNGNLSSGSL